MPALILQPAGAVALGKLAQARAAGARLLEVRGSFDQALDAARELASRGTHVLVNSLNPYRLEGQKTAAFELVEELGSAPDVLALPYGGGGNTCAYALGFREAGSMPVLRRCGRVGSCAGPPRARSASPSPRTWPESSARWPSRAVASSSSRTRRSSPPGATSPATRACSPSPRRPPASPRCCASLRPPAPGSSASITGHGLKDPDAVAQLGGEAMAVDPDPDSIAAAAA